MSEPKFGSVFPTLNRPEYPSSPEIFTTAIAWNLFDSNIGNTGDSIVFKTKSTGSGITKSSATPTFSKLIDRGSGLSGKLGQEGVRLTGQKSAPGFDLIGQNFVEGLLNGLTGTSSARSNSISVVPLTPALAMLQTVRGMKGTGSNFALMLEQIFALGNTADDESVSQLWLQSVTRQIENDPLLAAVEGSLASLFPHQRKVQKSPSSIDPWGVLSYTPHLDGNTPFHWFNRTWRNLNSQKWVDALPPRVWSDWASSVMRTAFGMSYLWEAEWAHRLSAQILDKSEPPQLGGIIVDGLLPWLPKESPMSIRSFGPALSRKLRTGGELRKLIQEASQTKKLDGVPYSQAVLLLRGDASFMSALAQAKFSPPLGAAHKSTVEAVTYSLKTRSEIGDGVDYYGLLRSKGVSKYLVIEPGTEWLAAFVSLTSQAPKGVINLGQVMENFSALGLNPPLGDLISGLERAGLATGSDDADSGLAVETAF
jgi:hypothetical protein